MNEQATETESVLPPEVETQLSRALLEVPPSVLRQLLLGAISDLD